MCLCAGPRFAVGQPAESAHDIVRRCELDKVARLQEYLRAHPQAADRFAAVDEQVKVYLRFGSRQEQNQALEEKLALVTAAPQFELKDYFNTLAMLVQLNVLDGNRARAEELVRLARTHAASHRERDVLTGLIDQLAGALHRPATGGKLEIAFRSLQGQAVDLAALRGKVVFVHFWATTCGPCVRELPALEKMYEKYHPEGLEFIGISLDDDVETVKRFIAQRNTPWPEYCDGGGWQSELAKRHGIFSLPSTFLLDRKGKIVATNLSGAQLEEAVAKELSQRE
jgi:thiol-disulfide isomerase/thioredoxin